MSNQIFGKLLNITAAIPKFLALPAYFDYLYRYNSNNLELTMDGQQFTALINTMTTAITELDQQQNSPQQPNQPAKHLNLYTNFNI
ncbi:hypothetical protein Glove_396g87 [Diversispora epigaea]|uniref:Uncharacterized protein n=1 Tax=Diversispora epigaea TaxID=1348612 RepID=A0A397H5B3_9GLOM|nr:hypothetical protein Glove_396g87 [Diversispora epigaea]